MGYQLRKVEDTYDRIAAYYDADYGTQIARAEESALRRLLAPYVDGRLVDDLGCGTGLLLDMFGEIENRIIFDYTGIDISLNMLDRAKRKHPGADFRHGNAWSIAPEVRACNSVISLFGSPSYSGLGEVIEGVKHRLRYGGGFFLMPYASGRLKAANGKLVDKHAELWRIHSTDHWRKTLELFGAREIEVRGFNLLRSSKLLRWETPLAKRFPDQSQYLIITGVM
mgnify:CR=1 FL=1